LDGQFLVRARGHAGRGQPDAGHAPPACGIRSQWVPRPRLRCFATLAIGRDVSTSITIFTASSLNSGEKLFFGRGKNFTFPDNPGVDAG